jgi:thiamine-phosphate pyrophosphorylase
MADRCMLYYITDRAAFGGDERARRRRLLEKVGEVARAGVDYIQLREKDLSARELESLAREAVRTVREAEKQLSEFAVVSTLQAPPFGYAQGRLQVGHPALLINSRSDVALAAGADGVHLRSDDISPREVRQIWKSAAASFTSQRLRLGSEIMNRGTTSLARETPLIGVSCHSPADVAQAAANGASFAVFAPVFEKKDAPDMHPAGLAQLAQACRAGIPVLALGGITLENARSCLEAGACGIAAIRLFQENDVVMVVKALRTVRRAPGLKPRP